LDVGQAKTATLTGSGPDDPPLDPAPPLSPGPPELLAVAVCEAEIRLGIRLEGTVWSNAVGTVKICPDEPVTTGEEGSTVALKKVTAMATGVPADVEIELEIKNTTPVGTALAGLRVTGTEVGWPAEFVPTENEMIGVAGPKVTGTVIGCPTEFVPTESATIGVAGLKITGTVIGCPTEFVPTESVTIGVAEPKVIGIVEGCPTEFVPTESVTIGVAGPKVTGTVVGCPTESGTIDVATFGGLEATGMMV
jgi:hypothetical protein